MDVLVIGFRLIITFHFSLLFGIERQWSHKSVGFGTFVFVSTASCALAITAIMLGPHGFLLGAVVTGVGFLSAGALIKTSDKIFGFTTASSIWVSALLGLILGVGQYFIGAILYVIVWVVVILDHTLEDRGLGAYQRKVIITTNKLIHEDEVKKLFRSIGIRRQKLITVKLDRYQHKLSVTYLVEGRKKDIGKISTNFSTRDWLNSISIE